MFTIGQLKARLDEFGDHVEVRAASAEDEEPSKEIVEVDDDISTHSCITLLFQP